jgi:hypothetical protein
MSDNIYLLVFIVLTVIYIYLFYSNKIKFRMVYALLYLVVLLGFFRLYMN